MIDVQKASKPIVPLLLIVLAVVVCYTFHDTAPAPVPDLAPPVPFVNKPIDKPEVSIVVTPEDRAEYIAATTESRSTTSGNDNGTVVPAAAAVPVSAPLKKSLWTPYRNYGKLARQTGKPVLVYFDGGPICQACERFKRNVLTDEAVDTLLREEFICVKLSTPEELAQWNVGTVPQVMFVKYEVILRPDGQRQRVAPQDVAEFLKLLDRVLKS